MANEFPARKTLEDKEMFDDIVKAILSVMGDDAVKIILYGSVARGDNTWESDVDIAVIVDGKYDSKKRDELFEAVYPLDLKYDTLFSVIPIESYHYFVCKYEIPFYMNIEKEGIILWKKCA